MFKQIKDGMTATSAVYLLLGVCLFVWPDTSIRLCCYALGALLLLSGGIQIWHFWRRQDGVFFLPYLSLFCGVLCLAAGLFLLFQPDAAVSIFPILFGLFVVLDSVARFGSAMELRRAGYDRWWYFLALSLLSIALGLFMILNPFDTVAAMVMAVGAILLAEGLLNLFSLLYARLLLARLERAGERLAQAAQAAEEEAQRQAVEEKARRHGASGPVMDVEARPAEEDD